MKRIALFLLVLLFGQHALAQQGYTPDLYPVIPRPVSIAPNAFYFELNPQTKICIEAGGDRAAADFLQAEINRQYQLPLSQIVDTTTKLSIHFKAPLPAQQAQPEAYQLRIDNKHIEIRGTATGSFYAVQTLLQLITRQGTSVHVKGATITDAPRFSWRGLHLDVARHFFTVDEVKQYLDWMARYKLNTFHWHLTDDQGWRIEIKKYPRLTSVGAWRNRTLIGHYSEEPDRYDSIHYGGFYTQDQIRDVVAYAQKLHITIVPEIEMPGHASAILAAYPEMGCIAGPFQVEGTWGVFDNVLCPSEKTFSFLNDVLTEVAALFPGTYIHIGGDECPKKQWKESSFCQQLMRDNKLKDENELQSWFVKRIVAMLDVLHKKAIGWDEILEGGLAPSAAVMSWRGEQGGIEAAKAGHEVVMTPTSYCYFDYYQSQVPGEPLAIGGFLSLEKVYNYEPIPTSFSDTEKKMILGVQANLWTEYIPNFSQVQYMIFPRITALAEVCWSPVSTHDWKDFTKRVNHHFARWKEEKINASAAMYQLRLQTEATADQRGIAVYGLSFDPKQRLEYTFSTTPDRGFETMETPIMLVRDSTTICVRPAPPALAMDTICQHYDVNLATGKNITLRKAPHKNYNAHGAFTLVDGIDARSPWLGSEWLGFWGDTLDATIDLQTLRKFSTVEIGTLNDPGSWIYPFGCVKIYASTDGINFQLIDSTSQDAFHPVYTRGIGFGRSEQIEARYVRVVVYGAGSIPEGFSGSSYPAWLFIDEIKIR